MKALKNTIIVLFLLIPALSFATNIGDYQSSGNVNFTTKKNWQTYNGTKWVNATTPPTLKHNTTTTVNNYATIDADIDIEGALVINTTVSSSNIPDINIPGSLIINSGNGLYFSGNINVLTGGTFTNNGQMNISDGTLTVSGNHTVSSTGQDYCFGGVVIQSTGTIVNNNVFQSYSTLNINGSLQTNGTNFYLSGNITVNNNAQVVFNQNGGSGSIPIATWNTGSTLIITGVTSSIPQNMNQSFYNLTWNCSSQSQDLNFYDGLKTVNGDLTFANTNNKNLTLFGWGSNSLNIGGNLNISGNTKVTLGGGGSSNVILNVNGNFSQSGGNLELGNSVNTMNIKGNFTSTGGKITRTSGSAKINFNGSSIQTFTSSNANESSNNVSLEIASGSSLVLASNMNVLGDANTAFTVYGTLNMGNFNIVDNFNFILNGTGTLICGTGVISTYGATSAKFDILNGGTISIGSPLGITTSGSTGNIQVNGARTYVSNAKYIYSGTSDQVTGNGLPANVSDFVMSNSDNLTLSNNVTVTDSLFITSGNLITGNYTFTLSNEKSGSLAYTSGLIEGKFTRAFSNSYSSYLFPVGTANFKRVVTLNLSGTPSSSNGTISVQYNSGDPGGSLNPLTEPNGYVVNTYSKDGSWQIDYSGTAGLTYGIALTEEGIQGVYVPSMLRIISRTNSSSSWALNGTHSNGIADPITARRNYLAFSPSKQFAIGGNMTDNPLDGSLPVELVSFASTVSNNTDVKLSWSTSKEINNTGFEVQRKIDNSDYQKIGFVKGNGNTNSTTCYAFEDKSLTSGTYSYRLKQIDNNGNFEYFLLNNKIEIGAANKFSLSQNYPNPFNPVTKINYAIAVAGQVTLKIYDVTGKEIKVLVNEVKSPGFYSIDFNGMNLASGIYIYRLTAKNFSDTKKMSLIK
ncbi:MAG: T9SS type A sorting domain-containing protein [Ignavibacteria bacterium]|jgi:hypothetical protein